MNTQNATTEKAKKGIPTQKGEVWELRKLGEGRVQVGIRPIPPKTEKDAPAPAPMPMPMPSQYVEVEEDAAPALGERIDIRYDLITSTPAEG